MLKHIAVGAVDKYGGWRTLIETVPLHIFMSFALFELGLVHNNSDNRDYCTIKIKVALDNSQASMLMGKPTAAACRGQFNYIDDAVFPPDSYDVEELDRFPDLMRMHIASPLGCRFSKSPQEREQILARRKEDLLKQARRKYLTKAQEDTE